MIGPTNARGGGGGINLKVVGGTTRPTNPRENTIWVNTTTAITGYVLSPTQPETGAEGLVWLKTADTGVEINVGRKNAVLLHLAMSQVYSSGSWKAVEGYVYKISAWVQFGFLALYKEGVFSTDHTEKVVQGSITYADTYYTAVTKGGSAGEAYVVFGPLSLDGCNAVTMRAKFIAPSTNTRFAIMVAKVATATRNNVELKTEVNITDKAENTISLDISTLGSGMWYVYAGINTGGGSWQDKRTVNVMEVGLA
nr:MAG TPA: hypothetical protein [Caudoviricetes sp.]